ncbi:MAG: molybdopterin molybdotransferase MoeA [Phormidesmis sp. RL_2_1]|nr:molybdopterin molybdotransferase MoeA [Phormidesmis sp. RL_2_1]
MFTAAEAERLIFTLVTPITAVETINMAAIARTDAPTDAPTDMASLAMQSPDQYLGRVLATAIRSPLDFPHWDNSAMDGYALRASDVQTVPVSLEVIDAIAAGQQPQKTIKPGQAARILTGAMMPTGADTVVMQEETERQGNHVTILQAPQPGDFVRQRGSFSQVGDVLLQAGQVITPAEIALLAAAQQTQVQVYQRPRIAILSTGSELVTPDQPMQPGQIVDSNQYALIALVAQTGAIPVSLGIVKDDRAAVKGAIAAALAASDMVISSGGVSVGDHDYIDDVLAELGATLHIRAVAVKPGKPLTVASIARATRKTLDAMPEDAAANTQLYFGLPGNPASAMVSFWRFVAPAIAKLSRQAGPWSPTFVWAQATTALQAGGQRETYLWGKLTASESGYTFGQAPGSHSSGNLVNLANTNGLGIIPQGETQIAIGQPLKVLKTGT